MDARNGGVAPCEGVAMPGASQASGIGTAGFRQGFEDRGMNMRPVIGVVIPALDPPEALSGLVGELRSRALGRIVVVNDGSADRSPFRALEAREEVTVLHDEARGQEAPTHEWPFNRVSRR